MPAGSSLSLTRPPRHNAAQAALEALAVAALFVLAPAAGPAAAQSPSAANADSGAAPDRLSAAAVREDLGQLYAGLQEAHYDLYARRSKAEYDAHYEAALNSIGDPLSRLEAAKLLQRFTAYGRVAHAHVSAPYELFEAYRQAGGTYLPLFVRVDAGRVFLTDTADAAGTLRAGDELLAIDGQGVPVWLDRLGRYVSADNDYLAQAQLEQRFPIALWLELGPIESVEVAARRPDGQRVALRVPALTREAIRGIWRQHPTPELEVDFYTREVRVTEAGVAYLRPGPFFNTEVAAGDTGLSYEDSQYRQFLDGAFEKILASGARDLVLDLRNNPGGDNSFSDPLVAFFADRPFRFTHQFRLRASGATKAHYSLLKAQGAKEDGVLGDLMRAEARHANGERYPFPIALVAPREGRRFSGKVYVLQNRHSYSNATSVAALVQDYKFGIIMGEETADLASTYGSSVSFKLKNSGFVVAYPKSHILRVSGDDSPRGVVPDVPLPPQPLGSSEDVVLKAAMDWIVQARQGR